MPFFANITLYCMFYVSQYLCEVRSLSPVSTNSQIGWLVGLCCLMTPGLSKDIGCHV